MKDSNLHLLPSQRSTLELMEHINGNFPEGGLPTPIDCDLFSLVSAQNDQSFEPCRCFLIATHALSLLKGQDTENNPKWWTWWESNPLPSACKADALPKWATGPNLALSTGLCQLTLWLQRRHWTSTILFGLVVFTPSIQGYAPWFSGL